MYLFIISVIGCSSGNINYDYDHTKIFNEYKSYKFVDNYKTALNGLSAKESILLNKIKIAVNRALTKNDDFLDKGKIFNLAARLRTN